MVDYYQEKPFVKYNPITTHGPVLGRENIDVSGNIGKIYMGGKSVQSLCLLTFYDSKSRQKIKVLHVDGLPLRKAVLFKNSI